MKYVYHMVPPDLRGTRLYPMNRLKEVYPDLYEVKREKYSGRERLMEEVIPVLNVLWNDVLHCAPIHPHTVYLALQRAGGAPYPERSWFKIPVEHLRLHRVVWFKYRCSPVLVGLEQARPDDFEPFSEAQYQELTELPPVTIQYYGEELRNGRRPLLFRQAPHVLVEGVLDTTGLEVIEWSQPPDQESRVF